MIRGVQRTTGPICMGNSRQWCSATTGYKDRFYRFFFQLSKEREAELIRVGRPPVLYLNADWKETVTLVCV